MLQPAQAGAPFWVTKNSAAFANCAAGPTTIYEHQNAASRVRKPQRVPSGRFALPAERLIRINDVGARTGNEDLDAEQDLVRLREKAASRGGNRCRRH
jgi:hypothetical protein